MNHLKTWEDKKNKKIMKFETDIYNQTFSEKVDFFSEDYLKCCLYLSDSLSLKYPFTKSLFSKLVYTSQMLEDLLDFHGAKNNNNWYFYRELSSAVRHISAGGFSQIHIINRLIFYDLPYTEYFENEGKKNLQFLKKTLIKFSPVIIKEAKRLNIRIPDSIYTVSDFPAVTTKEMLNYDISDENPQQQRKRMINIASEFLTFAAKFEHLEFYTPYNTEELLNIVPEKINEVEIRGFEMAVHNLQSSFDTYVIHGGYRFGNRELKQLRSFFSVIFHLLQLMGSLLHFYERHLHIYSYKNIYKKAQDKLIEIIDPCMILNIAVNYGLFNVCRYFAGGKLLAKEILNKNIERSSIEVSIPKNLGFHSRPSLLVAKIVNHYGGQVELCVGKDKFDASSILDIQWAGGKIHKEKISSVIFQGDKRALEDIKILAGVNYGEDTMGKGIPLPSELKYLK